MLSFGRSSLIISVDSDDNSAAGQVLDLLSQRRLDATWAFSRPAESKIALRLLANHPHSEVALLADKTWLNDDRTVFARELNQRLGRLSIQTLALSGVSATEHLTVLAKHQIGMIRPCPHQPSRQTTSHKLRATSVRFGIWQAPRPVLIQDFGRWLPARLAVACRLLSRSADQRPRLMHVCIDLRHHHDEKTVKHVSTFLDAVAHHRQRLELQTLSDLNRQMRPVQSASGRSVLRVA